MKTKITLFLNLNESEKRYLIILEYLEIYNKKKNLSHHYFKSNKNNAD